ncbi:MAG: hypothetical protein C0167_02115 [Nitrososphaera sp.]|nr:MAG: hypothetical protein C0167_02115 [Nitrososphaera sp.]
MAQQYKDRTVYVAIGLAVVALIVAAVAVAMRPGAAPAQQAPQVKVTYKLNLPENLTLSGNLAASPYYPILSGQEPLLWFNATVTPSNANALVDVIVYINGRSVVAGEYIAPVTNQPVYVDLTQFLPSTGSVDVKISFVAKT